VDAAQAGAVAGVLMIATDRRAWLHVYAACPSVVRLNERIVQFLLYALATLPAHQATSGHRWIGEPISTELARLLDHMAEMAP
jgi:hypothetical protein